MVPRRRRAPGVVRRTLGGVMGWVAAVAFEDHTLVETVRCYKADEDGRVCRRLLVFESGSAHDVSGLGWRCTEVGPGFAGQARREWACPEHVEQAGR